MAKLQSSRSHLACLLALTFSMPSISHDTDAMNVVGLGRDGKVARYQFSLHDSFAITSIAWSPDGKYIATSGIFSRNVHVWDVQKRIIAKDLNIEIAPTSVNSLTWSPDSRYLAACSGLKGRLFIYTVGNWSLSHIFDGQTFGDGACERAVFSSDGHEIALLSNNIAKANVGTWTAQQIVALSSWSRGRSANDIAYVPHTHDLLLGGMQFDVIVMNGRSLSGEAGYIWSLRDGESLPSRPVRAYLTPYEGGGPVTCLAMRPDGKEFATGTETLVGSPPVFINASVHFFDSTSGKLLASPLDGNLEFGEQAMISYSAGGRYVFIGHRDAQSSAIHIIDGSSHAIVDIVRTKDGVFGVSPEGGGSRFAATSGHDIDVWSMPQ